MSMLGDNRFGAHGDVMSATPDDEDGKSSLCEEIKSRAKAEFGRKNLPQAEMLYAKGIEVTPDDATLHSNLAAVRLGLNKPGEALVNAEESLRLDATYAKGHYRKGQALMSLSRFMEAAEAFRAGAALEPESKLWTPLMEKAMKASEEAPNLARKTRTAQPATQQSRSSSVTPSQATPEGSNKADAAQKMKVEGTDDSTGSGMKGYKKTADGRTTTYFHNELTDEAKALIGDIAPKRMEQSSTDGKASDRTTDNVSAWNKAGTWESRDMTSWAKQRLKELLHGIEFDAEESGVEIVKVDDLQGDAEISFSRGRKRYMFDFRAELKWEASDLDCGIAKGSLIYPDIGQDCDGEYDADCKVDSSTPSAARPFIDKHVRAAGSGLRQAVQGRLRIFAEEFNAK